MPGPISSAWTNFIHLDQFCLLSYLHPLDQIYPLDQIGPSLKTINWTNFVHPDQFCLPRPISSTLTNFVHCLICIHWINSIHWIKFVKVLKLSIGPISSTWPNFVCQEQFHPIGPISSAVLFASCGSNLSTESKSYKS